MDDLIKLVTKQAGISEAQAKKAVETIMDFIKDKLPGPLASHVQGLLSGGQMPDLGDLSKAPGDILGKKD